MGNLAKLLALAFVLGGLLTVINMRGMSRALTDKHIEQGTNILARNAARSGHDMVLAQAYDVIAGKWKSVSPVPVGTAMPNEGGRFWVTSYTPSALGDTLTFSIRAENLGFVHEITASYSWQQFVNPNPWILSGAPLSLDIAPGAQFNVGNDSVGVEVGVIETLTETLDSLKVPIPASVTSLTPAGLVQEVQDAFDAASLNITAKAVTDLDMMQLGEFAPDLLLRGIEDRIDDIRNTSLYKSIGASNAGSVNLDLGSSSQTGYVVEIGADATVDNLVGKGTLIVDGDLNVPLGNTMDWEGLVIVKGDGLKTTIDLKGNVRIQGALMTMHESGFSNIGHIDVSSWRDNTAWPWTQPKGSYFMNAPNDPPLYRHTHRYDVNYGKYVDYNGRSLLGFRGLKNHFGSQGPVQLALLRAQTAHGKSIYNFKLKNGPLYTGFVQYGFPTELRASNNDPFLTKSFNARDIETFNIYVQSRPHLQKSWDLAEGYGAHCGNASKGPRCVSQDYNRNGALTVRIYEPGDGTTHWESAIYWHMLQSEVSEYESDLNNYISELTSNADSGLDIKIGSNTTISSDRSAVNATGVTEGIGGPNLLSIAERQYGRSDKQNPCVKGIITGCGTY